MTIIQKGERMSDCISRQAAIDIIEDFPHGGVWNVESMEEMVYRIKQLPSAQPESCEITDEQAIEHLQSTGWMQNHDRQMYEMGLKEQLADDSGSYDSLIPNKDCISRQAAIDVMCGACSDWCDEGVCKKVSAIQKLPPAQQWIPCSERLPERGEDVLVTRDYDGRKDHNKSCRYVEVASCYGDDDDILWSSYSDEYKMTPKNHHVIAWMPLPEPYKAERWEDD